MKQKLLTLKALLMVLMMTLGFGQAFAADVTYTFKDATDNPGNAIDWFSASIDSYSTWSATKGGSNNPKYYDTGTGLRVYNGGTFSISSSKSIKEVVLTFSGESYTFSTSMSNPETQNPNATSYEWNVSRTCRLQKIEITYGSDPGKTSTTTTFSGESSYSVELGQTFNAPTASVKAGETAVTTPALTYSSSKTDVATINAETGVVILVGAGTTTIKATYEGDETYAASSASYTLTVTKPVPVFASLEELVADETLQSGDIVKVSFSNVAIKSIYTTSQSKRTGIYFDIQKADHDIEIYYNSEEVPAGWVAGGTVSGTMECPWTYYSNGQTWELAPKANTWAWTNLTYTAPAGKETATIEATAAKTALTVGTNDVYEVTYNGDGELSVKSSNESAATVAIEGKTVTVTPVGAGTASITISAPATENYTAATKSYSVTVTKPAALPFSFDGGKSAIDDTDGMSQNGLGTDYDKSPKLKFDSQGDNVIINFNEAAKKVTYTIKGNSTSGTYAFDVMESADGVNYTTVHSHTSITDVTSYTDNLASTSRFVKFVYTTKANGNVALGKISIVAANAVENPELAFAKTSYRFLTTDSEKSVSASSAKGSTGAITYSCDNTNLTIDATTGIITCSTAGTYTVKASIAAVEGYEAADATCTVTVIEPAVANSIIVAETNDGKYFAMTNTANSSGYLVSVEINKIDNKYYVSEENYDEILYAVSSTENSVTIVNKFNEYLQATAAKNVNFTENEYKWTLADNVLTAANSDHGTLQYNSSNPRFTTYGSKIGSYATIVSLDNVVKSNTATANLQITDAGVATFCAPFDVDLAVEEIDATAYTATVEDGWVKLSEIESGVIVAGTAVVLQGTEMAEAKTLTGVPATTEATCTTGCLTGNLSAVTSVAIGNFLLQKQTAGLAWYKVTEEGLKIGTNRCYLTKEAVTDARTVLNMDLNPTGIDSIATEAKTKADGKYLVNGKIVIVKAGKVYDLK